MVKRQLKRQLKLIHVVMLGTAGAIGAQIFVLTGHAAGKIGPALILALLIGGVLSYSIALNYGELASSFPETGGAMTYVREAWGKNLLSFLVGSLDCLSSVFFAALSAIGFAYSLQIFFPILPIIPTAIVITVVFIALNITGVSNIGNAQILLGGILLLVLVAYILFGLLLPGGFQWQTFLPEKRFFIHEDDWSNIYWLLSTVALVYVAYIGFEVIADDAEEVKNPDRNIPLGILLSLTIIIILYPLITLVTLGTIPWHELAGSETALTDAAARYLPGIGPLVLGITGVIATLTSLNTAMLSATREAFTLSRDSMWPRFLSRLGSFRTPYLASLTIGIAVCLITTIGLVDFLSYISSAGYLFVLFWSNLALIRLRKRYPNLRRPFKVPLYPWTVYIAMGTCFFIIIFMDVEILLYGLSLLSILSIFYYLSPTINRIYIRHIRSIEKSKNKILVPISRPETATPLIHMAAILAQASEDTNICVFHVFPSINQDSSSNKTFTQQIRNSHQISIPDQLIRDVMGRNIPIYTKTRESPSIAAGILNEVADQQNLKLILTGWPGPFDPDSKQENAVKVLVEKAQTNVAVFLERNTGTIKRILVPLGGGVHSRLALKIAYEIAEQENAKIVTLHTYTKSSGSEETEDRELFLSEIVEEELGLMPVRLTIRISLAKSIVQGVLDELKRVKYDLLVMGASEEWGTKTRLFGSVDDWIIEHVKKTSVLLIRRYEPVTIHWFRRNLKLLAVNIYHKEN